MAQQLQGHISQEFWGDGGHMSASGTWGEGKHTFLLFFLFVCFFVNEQRLISTAYWCDALVDLTSLATEMAARLKKTYLFSLLEENKIATNFNWPLNTVPHALRLLCATVVLWVLPLILWKPHVAARHTWLSHFNAHPVYVQLCRPREPVPPDLQFI